MKTDAQVFLELLEDEIVFNTGYSKSDTFSRKIFGNLLTSLMRSEEKHMRLRFDNGQNDGHNFRLPETTWDDLCAAKESFVAAMQQQGKSPETTVAILKKVFEPVFAARFEDHREIMSFLYRMTQDKELFDRILRA